MVTGGDLTIEEIMTETVEIIETETETETETIEGIGHPTEIDDTGMMTEGIGMTRGVVGVGMKMIDVEMIDIGVGVERGLDLAIIVIHLYVDNLPKLGIGADLSRVVLPLRPRYPSD